MPDELARLKKLYQALTDEGAIYTEEGQRELYRVEQAMEREKERINDTGTGGADHRESSE